MLTITCKEMKAMDSYAINNLQIPSIILMERAALKVVKNINPEYGSFTIVSGIGNNGGDGLAVARDLIVKRKDVDLFIIGDLEKATKDFNINLNILKNLGVKFTRIRGKGDLDILKDSLKNNDLTIDSIFGIGLTRDVEGLYRDSISLINDKSKETLAIDIPSGLDGDSGKALAIAVEAKKTITFHLMKKGLLKGEKYRGEVRVESIGIPEQATRAILREKI